MIGPSGYGPENWVAQDAVLPYQINFENLGPGSKDGNGDPYPVVAEVPAQRVVVTNQLSPDFDWSTFRITGLGFGDEVVQVPGESTHYAGTVTMTYEGVTFDVEMEAGIDFNTGVVTAVFQSIMPGSFLPVTSMG